MIKNIYITATGTDVGKTYTSAILAKALRDNGYNCGYYKPAMSGVECFSKSDAGYVETIAKICQEKDSMVSYVYKKPYSPHLASKIEGNNFEMSKAVSDYENVCQKYDFVVVEGCGGIICPIRWDSNKKILQEDIIKELNLSVIIVADAGLGAINSTVLTVNYIKSKNINIKGIIINRYNDSELHKDNIEMIEDLCGVSVVLKISENQTSVEVPIDKLLNIFK